MTMRKMFLFSLIFSKEYRAKIKVVGSYRSY
jgi:hypothetical protein